MTRLRLPCAESRQRKLTWPSREGDEPAVRDAGAVGIRAEVAQSVFRSAEGPLGVDDPVAAEQDSEPGGEAAWFRE